MFAADPKAMQGDRVRWCPFGEGLSFTQDKEADDLPGHNNGERVLEFVARAIPKLREYEIEGARKLLLLQVKRQMSDQPIISTRQRFQVGALVGCQVIGSITALADNRV
ncbi:hypothetical protein AXW67_35265 [Bradyrhizobium neotropicale]|uniref:Uncharacterized protein n=1 Tax=Bradyrhizobium neotropicale TaxID=1497615 RepID=A0A176ZIW4_9BRAD|nr:hypothetical protein AXW67_35265 [Bradyrhizobium neotropicale]